MNIKRFVGYIERGSVDTQPKESADIHEELVTARKIWDGTIPAPVINDNINRVIQREVVQHVENALEVYWIPDMVSENVGEIVEDGDDFKGSVKVISVDFTNGPIPVVTAEAFIDLNVFKYFSKEMLESWENANGPLKAGLGFIFKAAREDTDYDAALLNYDDLRFSLYEPSYL